MLPFTSTDFFYLAALVLLVVYLLKGFLSSWLPLRLLLFGLTVGYITAYFTQPRKAVLFVVWAYLVYRAFRMWFKGRFKIIGALLLALPLILVKAALLQDRIQFVGLSYVTFRVVQIHLDADSGQPVANLLDYVTFLLFPPTLLIGPIDRFQRFKSDLDLGYSRLNLRALQEGWQLILHGLVLKFVLAALVNSWWLGRADDKSHAVADLASNMYGYAFYLYFDFAGYSALAAGLGVMFGIAVPANFNHPFLAPNPQEFWRRWHITLGDWLRDYIFRPCYKWASHVRSLLSHPLLRQNTSLFVTFFVMGLWNGFHRVYLVSGSLFGLYSVVHNTYVYQCRKRGRDLLFGTLSPLVVRGISVLLMFNFAAFALYVFSGRFPFLPLK